MGSLVAMRFASVRAAEERQIAFVDHARARTHPGDGDLSRHESELRKQALLGFEIEALANRAVRREMPNANATRRTRRKGAASGERMERQGGNEAVSGPDHRAREAF